MPYLPVKSYPPSPPLWPTGRYEEAKGGNGLWILSSLISPLPRFFPTGKSGKQYSIMAKMKTASRLLAYFANNLLIVIGLVLIWRGIWYVLDGIDLILFNNDHFYTAIGGIIVGLLVLYLPDKDLKEIQKL